MSYHVAELLILLVIGWLPVWIRVLGASELKLADRPSKTPRIRVMLCLKSMEAFKIFNDGLIDFLAGANELLRAHFIQQGVTERGGQYTSKTYLLKASV